MRGSRKYPIFDAVRGIAAIAVFSDHAYWSYWASYFGTDGTAACLFQSAGWWAVTIFFFLSGLLIAASIQSNISRNTGFDLSGYAIARIARIYPPLIGAIAVTVTAWMVIKAFSLPGSAHDLAAGVRDSFELNYKEIMTALLMRGGLLLSNGPLWSLYLEWQLYILAGVTALLLTSGTVVFRFFAAVIGGYILWETQSENWIYFGVWIFGAAVSFSPIWRIRLMVPRILVETGDFSYSLYVIHFLLLLLSMSLFQEWMGDSVARRAIVFSLVVPSIIFGAYWFAVLLERPERWRKLISKAVEETVKHFRKQTGQSKTL